MLSASPSDAAERAVRGSPGLAHGPTRRRHRLGLLHHQPSVVVDPPRSPAADVPGRSGSSGREAIDAGAADAAVDHARYWARPVPHLAGRPRRDRGGGHRRRGPLARRAGHRPRSGAATHRRRRPRRPRPPRPPGSRAGPSACGSSAPPRRLRDETGYRWRFGFEQQPSIAARAAASRPSVTTRTLPRPTEATSTGATPPPTPVAPEASANDLATDGPASRPPNTRLSPSSPKA